MHFTEFCGTARELAKILTLPKDYSEAEILFYHFHMKIIVTIFVAKVGVTGGCGKVAEMEYLYIIDFKSISRLIVFCSKLDLPLIFAKNDNI